MRDRAHRFVVALTLVVAVYVAIAYWLVPLGWREYAEDHPAFVNNPRLTVTADGHPGDVHGEYAQAAKDVARELNTYLIDLNQLSMDALAGKGQEYVTEHYFMNLPAGVYEAYPEGQKDNTHFQPEGARAVAGLVYEALRQLK